MKLYGKIDAVVFDRDTLRRQMLTANECVAALDKALNVATGYHSAEMVLAAFRGVRQEYSRKRDELMIQMSTLPEGHRHAD